MKNALNFINQIHDQLLHLLKPKNKQRVLVDLHQLSTNLWCTHFTDEFTRYSTVVIVRNKAVCHKAFIKHWISIFGATKKIFSPWRNGTFEQHNQTLKNNTTCVAKAINHAEKATGKYNNCYNIEYKAPLKRSGKKHGLI